MTFGPRVLATVVAVSIAGLRTGSAAAAPTAEQKCESAVQAAAAKFVACRLAAESRDAKSPDPVKLAMSLSRCSDKLATAIENAVVRFGDESCTAATPVEVPALSLIHI